MELYFKIASPLTNQQKTAISAQLNSWIEESQGRIKLSADDPNYLLMSASRSQHLKVPVNHLYQLARQHKIDFELGIAQQGQFEAVCYFGAEEGRPDIFEMSMYLGL